MTSGQREFFVHTAALVSEVTATFFSSGSYKRNNIAELAQLAVYGDEEAMEAANRAIFGSLVEQLADTFEPSAVTLYNKIFAQLVQFCRHREWELDRALTRFGLPSEQDLVNRADGLATARPQNQAELVSRMERVVVLSRVTLGADVAVTSVILERVKRELPRAEIILVGDPKASELFGGSSSVRFQKSVYRRSGTLVERLLCWFDTLASVQEAFDGAAPGRRLVIDPDTRLTQLGILPVAGINSDLKSDDESRDGYFFFPSRSYGSGTDKSLASLTSRWLDEIFGRGETILPRVILARHDRQIGSELVSRLRRTGTDFLVTMNLGVGENPAKRVGASFEKSLIEALLRDRTTVVLDRGIGATESERIDELIKHANAAGARVIEVDEAGLRALLSSEEIGADLVVWRGRIGLFASMIERSNLYIGYDSACQHIAAALAVPCIDVFTGYSSKRMLHRWRPTGPAEAHVIDVDRYSLPAELLDAVAERVRCIRQLSSR